MVKLKPITLKVLRSPLSFGLPLLNVCVTDNHGYIILCSQSRPYFLIHDLSPNVTLQQNV